MSSRPQSDTLTDGLSRKRLLVDAGSLPFVIASLTTSQTVFFVFYLFLLLQYTVDN